MADIGVPEDRIARLHFRNGDEARDQLAEFRGWYDRVCCYGPSFGLSGVEIADRIDAAVDTFGVTR